MFVDIRIGQQYEATGKLVRSRLQFLGDLPPLLPVPENSLDYSGAVAEGVKHFQPRHGLDSSGKLGAQTITELNRADERPGGTAAADAGALPLDAIQLCTASDYREYPGICSARIRLVVAPSPDQISKELEKYPNTELVDVNDNTDHVCAAIVQTAH